MGVGGMWICRMILVLWKINYAETTLSKEPVVWLGLQYSQAVKQNAINVCYL